jgi:hypothetical protein
MECLPHKLCFCACVKTPPSAIDCARRCSVCVIIVSYIGVKGDGRKGNILAGLVVECLLCRRWYQTRRLFMNDDGLLNKGRVIRLWCCKLIPLKHVVKIIVQPIYYYVFTLLLLLYYLLPYIYHNKIPFTLRFSHRRPVQHARLGNQPHSLFCR